MFSFSLYGWEDAVGEAEHARGLGGVNRWYEKGEGRGGRGVSGRHEIGPGFDCGIWKGDQHLSIYIQFPASLLYCCPLHPPDACQYIIFHDRSTGICRLFLNSPPTHKDDETCTHTHSLTAAS